METVLITDSHSDFPLELIEQYKISFIGPMFSMNGRQIEDDLGKSMSYKDFYAAVRAGEMPITHQINPYRYENLFEPYVKEGKSIIYLGFSSTLSGSLNSAYFAKEELQKKYENADITIIDTLSASLGQGLLVYYANEMLNRGCSKDEIVNWVENNKLKVNHLFTVDDLNHLKRGGRISNTAALIGTLLSFKPILKINDEGKLLPIAKERGRKKALRTLVETMKGRIMNPEEQIIFISHGDCEGEVEHLKDMISKELNVKAFITNYIGSAVGTHAGPGAIAIFFLGGQR